MALNFANNNSLSAITALPASISGGALTLLQTQTASASATIDFTSNIDSTYDAYVFKFYEIHPATDGAYLTFNMSTDSGSNYNVTKTSSSFHAFHNESDTVTSLSYDTVGDLAQSTGNQYISNNVGNDNDQNVSGTLTIFNPSSSVFVKHFISNTNVSQNTDYSINTYVGGYGNTTNPIDAIQFLMTSGNIDSGVIKLYGIS